MNLNVIPKGGLAPKIQKQFENRWQTAQTEFQQTQAQLNAQSDPNRVDPTKAYAHKQPWRLTRYGGLFSRLGAMGTYDSEIIIAIQLQDEVFYGYEQIIKSNFGRLSQTQLLADVRRYVYEQLKGQMFAYMRNVVPRDTERLLNAMELAIAGGRSGGGGQSSSTSQLNSLHPFFVVLNTGNVPYAKVLEGMGNHVKHYGNKKSYRTGRIVKRKPHPLNDPQASSSYFKDSVNFGRDLARTLWDNFKRNQLTRMLSPIFSFVQQLPARDRPSNNEIIDALFEVEIPPRM